MATLPPRLLLKILLSGVARPVEKRNWSGDATVRVGFKEGLQQSRGLVGGLLRLTVLALLSLHPAVGTRGQSMDDDASGGGGRVSPEGNGDEPDLSKGKQGPRKFKR
ncbi:uncharacterized protein LOC120186910 [Hibiscus syriacus]|uniref:uncharacterized protein LOC120186910 n=1 Tax=Hibiscus syriacus TaxID=106335 RepID=UPI001922C28C|nr:uncharacterized protein LOC120186910 [Hibiscus syriacus]